MSVAALYLIESDAPAKRARPSLQPVLAYLDEAEGREREGQEPYQGPDRRSRPSLETVMGELGARDYRVRMIGPKKNVRWLVAIAPGEDATDEDIQAALEELHRGQTDRP